MVAEPVGALRDALTGLPLDPGQSLWRCARCRAAFHADSRATLAAENDGNCLSCGHAVLEPVLPAPAAAPAPALATLTARVCWLGPAAEPGFIVALLEDKPWRQARKLVFPPGVTHSAAAARFIAGLEGRTVTVGGRMDAEGPLGPRIVVTDLAAVRLVPPTPVPSTPATGGHAHVP